MASFPSFPLVIIASGDYPILAPGAHASPLGTLVQLTGTGSWSAGLLQNIAAGTEPYTLAPVPYVDRSTGYLVTDGSVFGETSSPVTVEVPTRQSELWLRVTINSGTGITVMCSRVAQSVQRPAGAFLSDLNFDATPTAMVELDIESEFDRAVAAYNNT